MPTLRRLDQANRDAVPYRLLNKMTSLGRSSDCDIVIDKEGVAPTHCHIRFDGCMFQLASIGRCRVEVNGKRKKKHDLVHGDRVRIGDADFEFRLHDRAEVPTDTSPEQAAADYRMLFDFSGRLLGRYELCDLLDALMDAVIAVAHADKGFLVLFEDAEPKVRIARNLRKENIDDTIDQLSDSIVAKVVSTKRPLIVSDALNDDEFANAKSVINLNVVSVMCVPLMDQESLLGIIYVGNDSVVHLFDNRSLELLTVFAAQASLIIKNAVLVNDLRLDNEALVKRLESARFGSIIGSCDVMREVFRKVERVAGTDVSVLISGETGTGKELVATEIHQRSPRAKGPFVTINCGAIPENLLESELFGHVKGAFTGAVGNKRGKFQAAHGGTLFLDEIGELPIQLQVKLLRALQDKAVVRVGDTRPESVDIRVLTATNRRLEDEIAAGRFREDLFYRVNVVEIELPPLRDRGDDIMVIAKYLLHREAAQLNRKVRGFSPDAVIAILKHSWPGNIRQLENHIKKAVIMADRPVLAPEDLDLRIEEMPPTMALAEAREEFQRRYINQVLVRNNGNRTKTARDLGVDPRTIFRHLEREEELLQDADT